MLSRFGRITIFAIAGFAVAFAQEQQPPPPESDQPSRGWRKFGAPRDDQSPPPRYDQAGPPPQYDQPVPPQLVLPAGTWVTVRVNNALSSDHNQPGDTFTATLSQPLVVNGFVIARRGQTIGGRVAEARKAGRAKGTSMLGFELTELTLADGQQMPIRTQLMEYGGGTSKGRDATAIGTTTGVGAAIGAAAGGGMGAGIGAAAGAVASTIGVLMTRGRATEVYPETPVTFRTLDPLTISTERSQQAFLPARQGDYSTQLQPRTVVQQAPPSVIYGGGWGGWGPYWGGGPGWYGPGWYGPSVGLYYGRGWGGYRGWGGGRGWGRRW